MVYVDDAMIPFRRMKMSHMFADSVEELHDFAAKLGLKREWFQDKSAPHYDVSLTVRKRAIELGAVAIGYGDSQWREVFRRIRKPRDKRNR
jgi:hypothetical protein